MILKIEEARALVGKDEPRGRKQVIIREWVGNSWIKVGIGRYVFKKEKKSYRNFRLTADVDEIPRAKTWAEALQLAIQLFEKQLPAQAGKPVALSLAGDDLKVWTSIKEIAPRLGMPLTRLPEFLLKLCSQSETTNEESEN